MKGITITTDDGKLVGELANRYGTFTARRQAVLRYVRDIPGIAKRVRRIPRDTGWREKGITYTVRGWSPGRHRILLREIEQ